MPAVAARRRRRGWWLAGGVVASAAILAYLVSGSLPGLAKAAGSMDGGWVLAAVVTAAASYVMMALALWDILTLLGHSLPFMQVLGIAFVSSTANYVVSSVGVSGFALKAHLLNKRQVPYGATVTASVVSTGLMYFVLAVFIGQGLAYLLLRMQGLRVGVLEGALGLGALGLTSVPLFLFFFNRDLRGAFTSLVFRWVNRAAFMFSRREIPRETFAEFEEQLEGGLAGIHARKGRLTLPIAYTCLDWMFALLALYCCLRGVGLDVSLPGVGAAFAVAQAATLIPALPGGLGAMEGAVSAVLQGMGQAWEPSLAAALLYRAAYYFVPGIASVFILWGLTVSEPTLIRDTALETLPEERRRRREGRPRPDGLGSHGDGRSPYGDRAARWPRGLLPSPAPRSFVPPR